MSKVLNNYIQSLENKLARLRNPETTEEEQKATIVGYGHGGTITLRELVVGEECVSGKVEIINLQDPKYSRAWSEEFQTRLRENLE